MQLKNSKPIIFFLLIYSFSTVVWANDDDKYLVLLKAGSIIKEVGTSKKELIVEKSKKVYIKNRPRSYKYVLILDKNSNPKYFTSKDNVEVIDTFLNNYPQNTTYKTYSPRSKDLSVDDRIHLQNSVKIHHEFIDSSYLVDLFDEQYQSQTNVFRHNGYGNLIEFKSFYKIRLPVDPGIIISYRQGEIAREYDIIRLSGFYAGPALRLTISDNYFYKHYLGIGVLKSFKSQGYTPTDNYFFSSNVLQLDYEAMFRAGIGKILLGISYRRYHTSLLSTTETVQTTYSSRTKTSQSLALNAGIMIDLSFSLLTRN